MRRARAAGAVSTALASRQEADATCGEGGRRTIRRVEPAYAGSPADGPNPRRRSEVRAGAWRDHKLGQLRRLMFLAVGNGPGCGVVFADVKQRFAGNGAQYVASG